MSKSLCALGKIDHEKIQSIFDKAIKDKQPVLLEHQGLELLQAAGLNTPKYAFIERPDDAVKTLEKSPITGAKVVVKVISPEILHKSDVGGVAMVENSPETISSALKEMDKKFKTQNVLGYTVNQCIEYDKSLGHELLFGLRWAGDFGPILTLGAGGIYTEFLASNFKSGKDVSIIQPEYANTDVAKTSVEKTAIAPLLFGGVRGQKGVTNYTEIEAILAKFSAIAQKFMPKYIKEFEVNPFVVSPQGIVALDVLIKLNDPSEAQKLRPPRPIHKLKNLLQPKSAAIIGVSEKMNSGHIILNNLIRDGFAKDKIFVIKPNTETIEGVKCYPDIASLPERVDMFVLAIAAAQVPSTVTQLVEHEKAESIIVIPGGLEEKAGTSQITAQMYQALERSRKTDWKGPIVNGGNCLGIRSVPGKYDTMFIPEYKQPVPTGPVSPAALISQSGAFVVSRANKLSQLNLKYSISVGNQTDLTLGDYLTYLKDDPDIKIFAVYAEGFRPQDGKQFLNAAQEIIRSGKTVILYRAGRTAAGAKASASHTAAIAGDYAVTRELAENTGIVIADTFADFDDLIKLFTFLEGKKVRGTRLGAVSNAGCECVAIADNLGKLTLTDFEDSTNHKLGSAFKECRIDEIVDVHNPVDLTPMAGDEAYERVFRAVLEDSNIDVGVLGFVPITPAMNTLPKGPGHREDLTKADSTAHRLAKIKQDYDKPWVAVVDAGSLYDPLVKLLEDNHIPTFDTADRALKLLNKYCASKVC